MTTRRVKLIAKREDQRRDDRSIMTRMKMCDYLPKVTSKPKSNLVVRALMPNSWGSDNTVSIKSAKVSGDQIYFSELFPDYIQIRYQINCITVFGPRNYTSIEGTTSNTSRRHVTAIWRLVRDIQCKLHWRAELARSTVGDFNWDEV